MPGSSGLGAVSLTRYYLSDNSRYPSFMRGMWIAVLAIESMETFMSFIAVAWDQNLVYDLKQGNKQGASTLMAQCP